MSRSDALTFRVADGLIPELCVDAWLPSVSWLGLAALGAAAAAIVHIWWRRAAASGVMPREPSDDRRFRDLAESLPHMVWTCEPDGRCDYLGPQWLAYTGAPEAEQLGYGWLARLHPEDVALTQARWAAAAASGSSFDIEFRIRRHDGAYRWFKTRAVPVRDARGQTLKWYGSNTDIQELRDAHAATERVAREHEAAVLARTEQLQSANLELASSAARLERLTERLQLATTAASAGVWDWNVRDNQLFWDDIMHRLYDVGPDFDRAYDGWLSRVHPEDRAQADADIKAALFGQREFDTHFRVVRPNGEVRHIRASGLVHRDPVTGEPVRMVGINQEVTAQRTAELALRSSEALQRALLAHAGSAIIATDPSGIITLFNPAAEELLGYSAAEVVQRASPGQFHVPAEVQARRAALELELGRPVGPFEAFVARSVALGKPDTREWTYVRKNGARLPVLLTVTTLRDPAGAVFGHLGIAIDLTEQKRHEAELETLNQLLRERSAQAESASHAKGMFLANMSHEIRTPMGAIAGVSYLLSRTPLSLDQQDLLAKIERANSSLLAMVNDILDLSKIEAGQLTLEAAPFAMLGVLDDVAALMGGIATGKSLELIVDLDPLVPNQLVGDRVRLLQILTNLVGNAVKFTDQGSVRLRVECAELRAPDAHVSFMVEDTGPGVDAALRAKLFTPFTQGDSSHTRRKGGTGLGLAIVRELATLMGGELGLESTVGVGSRFWCRLPFRRAEEAEPAAVARGLHVLVVDDHDGQRRALSASLRRFGWTAEVAASGREALSLLSRSAGDGPRFDALVLDWQLPDMEASAVARAVDTTGGPRPCVIMTVASDPAEPRTQTGAERADVLLAKPVTPSALYEAISGVLVARTDPPEVRPRAERPAQRLLGVRILVADDAEINRVIAKRILELEGAEVLTARDGREAVQFIESHPDGIDAVLMDLQMPELDGVEATALIRALPARRRLPIIALTAGALASDQKRALDASMNDFVTKPFDTGALIECLRRHLQRAGSLAGAAGSVAAAGWPAIDDIDVDAARLRLGGDAALYRSLLELWLPELEAMERLTPAVLEPPGRGAFAARLHDLKATAGNLGGQRLRGLAAELEDAMRADDRPAAAAGVQRLAQEAGRTRCAVRRVLFPDAVDAGPGALPAAPPAPLVGESSRESRQEP